MVLSGSMALGYHSLPGGDKQARKAQQEPQRHGRRSWPQIPLAHHLVILFGDVRKAQDEAEFEADYSRANFDFHSWTG